MPPREPYPGYTQACAYWAKERAKVLPAMYDGSWLENIRIPPEAPPEQRALALLRLAAKTKPELDSIVSALEAALVRD